MTELFVEKPLSSPGSAGSHNLNSPRLGRVSKWLVNRRQTPLHTTADALFNYTLLTLSRLTSDVYSVHCTLNSAYCTVYTAQYTLHSVQCTLQLITVQL